jgi:hypothetical protein
MHAKRHRIGKLTSHMNPERKFSYCEGAKSKRFTTAQATTVPRRIRPIFFRR